MRVLIFSGCSGQLEASSACRLVLPLALGLVLASAAAGSDGVVEINQTCAVMTGCTSGDAPGFPVTLTQSTSCRLTGALQATADTTAIEIQADGVRIDLNGFSIVGTSTCAVGDCPSGSASGITRPGFPAAGGGLARIANGMVRGFSGDCINLGPKTHVEDMLVDECGLNGIVLADSSRARGNTVGTVGRSGLVFQGSGSIMAHNIVSDPDAAGSGARAVAGIVHATAGNSCPDSSCTPRGNRRFYLTNTLANGAQARAACTSGFHMASIYEILDPTDLVYDHALGLSPTGITDPIGPTPMGISFEGLGWVRTGAAPSVEFSGAANCLGYTSSAALDTYGTTIGLSNGWELPASIDSEVTPWSFTTASCDRARPVWCVED